MNYYNHNIGDYRRDTAHLSLLEHGIYRQLLDWYYLDECEIPKETQVVMRRLSARTQDEQNSVEIILKEFFVATETGWKHKRCDVEIAHYQEKADKNRTNGKLGGRPRKTQVDTERFLDGKPNESEQNLNQEPITNNQYKKHTCEVSHFDEFWKAYPSQRRVAKKTCFQKWKAKKLDTIAETILGDVRAKAEKWGEFAPAPLTYLNQERWLDGNDPGAADDWRKDLV